MKKRYLIRFFFSLVWFLLGGIPIVSSLEVLLNLTPAAGRILLIIGWISTPVALILAIYYLSEWINS